MTDQPAGATKFSIPLPKETAKMAGVMLRYLATSKKNGALAAGLTAHAHAADLGIDPKFVLLGTLASILGIAAKDVATALRAPK